VLVLLLVEQRFVAAFAVFIVSALSDLADGMIARHWNLRTRLGAIADPLADKLTIAGGRRAGDRGHRLPAAAVRPRDRDDRRLGDPLCLDLGSPGREVQARSGHSRAPLTTACPTRPPRPDRGAVLVAAVLVATSGTLVNAPRSQA